MSILIANIGTSDLAIKIDDYYFPLGFDRTEPNLNESNLTDDEKAIWERDLRQSYIDNELCRELEVPVGKSKSLFRELTRKILEAYQQDEETWHQRIRPGRIWGVLKTAQEPRFQVKVAYLFVTDQPEKEPNGTLSKGYLTDSIYLFDILEKWFKREIPHLTLRKQVIPPYISAVDQDGLLNYYYQFFQTVNSSEPILISIKGGTPQMQTALKLQAIASGIPKQLFIDPKLSIKNVLTGELSECQFTSYWRYMRNQKYQAVSLLLKRWDFDGAMQILKNWNKVLDFLIKEKVTDEIVVSQNQSNLLEVIEFLSLGINYMNLDYKNAKKIQNKKQQSLFLDANHLIDNKQGERLLNLYTQCRICWQLDQMANFLVKMSSFYEETLYQIVAVFDGQQYFHKPWLINTPFIRQKVDSKRWQAFLETKGFSRYNPNQKKQLKLENRFDKINFIEELLLPEQEVTKQEQYKILSNYLNQLNFWAKQRNDLIHSAEGVSQEGMKELWRSSNQEKDTHCAPEKIRDIMAKICNSELGLIREEDRKNFVGKNAAFYLYSEIQRWVLDRLKEEIGK